MAEGEGFEPSVPYWTRRLSRAVHSTTLPPFRIWFSDLLHLIFPATDYALYIRNAAL